MCAKYNQRKTSRFKLKQYDKRDNGVKTKFRNKKGKVAHKGSEEARDKSNLKYYNYGNLGHFARKCTKLEKGRGFP